MGMRHFIDNIKDELGTDYLNEISEDDDNTRPQSPIINFERGMNVIHPRRPIAITASELENIKYSSTWRCSE